MHDSISNLILIKKEIQEINPICQLIVVTKTFSIEKIEPIIKMLSKDCMVGQGQVSM